jgi:hypothetical protein
MIEKFPIPNSPTEKVSELSTEAISAQEQIERLQSEIAHIATLARENKMNQGTAELLMRALEQQIENEKVLQ